MSDGPDLPGPSTCERCGRPASSALFDTDGTRYLFTPCLRLVVLEAQR
jgi:hypothetical protein